MKKIKTALFRFIFFALVALFSLAVWSQEKEKKEGDYQKKQLPLLSPESYENMKKEVQRERKKSLPSDDPCRLDDKCHIENAPQRTVGGTRG